MREPNFDCAQTCCHVLKFHQNDSTNVGLEDATNATSYELRRCVFRVMYGLPLQCRSAWLFR